MLSIPKAKVIGTWYKINYSKPCKKNPVPTLTDISNSKQDKSLLILSTRQEIWLIIVVLSNQSAEWQSLTCFAQWLVIKTLEA